MPDTRDPLIGASDDLADAIAALAVKIAPGNPGDFIRGVCEVALRLTRRNRGSGSYRVQACCQDDIGGYVIEDPAGEPVGGLWFTSESHAVSAASGLNRQRIQAAGFVSPLEVLNGGRAA